MFEVQLIAGKHCCTVRYENNMYVFRYAYDTAEEAAEVMGRLQANFGKPAGVPTDLAMNYWRVDGTRDQFRPTKRTSQKDTWYLCNNRF